MSNRDTNARIREFFAKGSDRADSARLNPLFTGREGIIDGLVGHVREVLDSEKPGSGRTHLVYGSQGVGKSELMLQFISKLEQLDLGDLIVMRAPPDALWNAQVFFNAFRSSSSRTAWNTIDERAAELGSIGIAGMVSIARQPKPPITQNDEQQTALLQEFAHVIRNQFNNPAIVLCVDEIQSGMPARSDTPGRWSGFAPRFENGEIDMKIMPVFFGLGNSKERLGNCGLSRLNIANVFQMRGLDDADIRRAARIFLESLEGDQPAHTEAHYWLGAIVKYTSGWPRHLSNCLSVIARWSEHSNTRLDARAFGACMREAHEIKQDYYGAVCMALP